MKKEHNEKVIKMLDELLKKYKKIKTQEELMGLVLVYSALIK